MTLQNYFSIKIPSKRLTPNSELLSFFNIQSILNKEHKSLINLSKLLLCISSFCSIKNENLKKVSGLELSLVKVYYNSVYLFLLKNIDKKSSSNNNILTNSILEEDRNSDKDKKEIEKLKRIIEEKDSIIREYKTSELMKHDISVIQTDVDFLGGADDITMMNFDLDFDIKNKKVNNYQIEKNITFSFAKLNMKQIFMDSLPTSQKNTNNSNNSSQNYSISKYSLDLSGGNFFQNKIDYLGETISKNRQIYEKIINDYEFQIKILKEKIKSLKYEHNEEISKIIKKQEFEIQKIINDKNINNSEELIRFRNEKNLEIQNLRNTINQKENMKNKEIEEIQNKLKEEKVKREKEVDLFNMDRVKIVNEYDKKIKNLNDKMTKCNNELETAKNKLKSAPYFAREVISKTLFNFAAKIMENE